MRVRVGLRVRFRVRVRVRVRVWGSWPWTKPRWAVSGGPKEGGPIRHAVALMRAA